MINSIKKYITKKLSLKNIKSKKNINIKNIKKKKIFSKKKQINKNKNKNITNKKYGKKNKLNKKKTSIRKKNIIYVNSKFGLNKYPINIRLPLNKTKFNEEFEKYKSIILDNKIKYPVLNMFEPENNIKLRMNNLRSFKPVVKNINYSFKSNLKLPKLFLQYRDLNTNIIKPSIIIFDNTNYEEFDLISDYFQEEPRMKCQRYNSGVSPFSYWQNLNNRKKIIHECVKKFNGVVNVYTLRETLFNLTNACSSFRPTVIVSLIKLFGNRKRILDISSGWGDRLIGSIAANVDYYFGVDPNPDLHEGYNNIIKFFNVDKKKFIIKKSGFEKVKIQMPPNDKYGNKQKFDIIMTSPPYFDLEIYTQKTGQSVLNRGKKAWLEQFMYPSLKKAWNVLEDDGILALNINNKREENAEGYVEDIIEYMNNMEDSDFRGCIAYGDYNKKGDIRNPQPVWIWRKLPDIKQLQKQNQALVSKQFNPTIKIVPVSIPNPDKTSKKKTIKINVIRDDLLEAGAKQRAMIPFFREHSSQEFVYLSPVTGSAQVTLSYSSLYTGKRTTIFMDKIKPRHPLTKKAMSYGLKNIIEVKNGSFKTIQPIIDNYMKWKKLEKGNNFTLEFSLGFANQRWIQILAEQIKKALPKKLLTMPPKRIWVPTGSTALVNALYLVFPTDKYPQLRFIVVQTGKTVWDDQVDLNRTTIYRTEEFFYDKAKRQPPFPTSEAYDAKAWGFVLDHAEDNDYLVNVISDPK
jgi:hypothetical protein